jgi:hypothetical protein
MRQYVRLIYRVGRPRQIPRNANDRSFDARAIGGAQQMRSPTGDDHAATLAMDAGGPAIDSQLVFRGGDPLFHAPAHFSGGGLGRFRADPAGNGCDAPLTGQSWFATADTPG